jgi:hypothetical protein
LPKLPYQESSIFSVPLRGGGFARGVVARMRPRGRILLGYFFGPRTTSPNQLPDSFFPQSAILVGMFGDLHLIDGRWDVLGAIGDWRQEDWPIPEYRGVPHELVLYDDDLTPRIYRSRIATPDLPSDSLMGAGAVEIKLDRLLG